MRLLEKTAFTLEECATRSNQQLSNSRSPSSCDARHDVIPWSPSTTSDDNKAGAQRFRCNSSIHLHRAVPVILDRLDLDLAPAHVCDKLRLSGSGGWTSQTRLEGVGKTQRG